MPTRVQRRRTSKRPGRRGRAGTIAARRGASRRRPSAPPDASESFTITNHRLSGPAVTQRATPNCGGAVEARYLVFHYTAGRSAEEACAWLCNPAAKASAHLVIGRDGSVTQLAPFNVKTWHAGVSQWEGLNGLNQYAIGIEMDNPGPLREAGDHLLAWFGAPYPKDQAIHATHKFEHEARWWHTFTEVQIRRALDLALLLVRQYGLHDVIGHDDIAPDRKRDPGPAFPLESIRARVLGRQAETRERVRVVADALNIRKGPGAEFDLAGPPLAKGAEVWILEKGARWSKVDVSNETDLEGWVANRFIEPIPA